MSRHVTFCTRLSGGGVPMTNISHTGEFTRSGLNDIQISLPSVRMVGTSRSSDFWLMVSASSIQQCVKPSYDLMRSGFVRSPANRNSVPLAPRISASVLL